MTRNPPSQPGSNPCAAQDIDFAVLKQRVDDHIDICGKRYEAIERMFKEVEDRLDRLHGRWWKVIWTMLLGSMGIIVSLIVYIWTATQH